ncbi:MAG: sulfite oxidase [Chloroflexi bacterium]|nr:sulfite oxidase [Chloroflexota bacterium]
MSDGQERNSDLITRTENPDNLESPFDAVDRFLTPNSRFFVRSHYLTPQIEVADWRLLVEGSVDRPLALGYDEIVSMAPTTLPATLECAGNSRGLLKPPVKGLQWQTGAVSTAEWTGPRLADVLARAGVSASAREVILEGADRGPVDKDPSPAGETAFARSIPLELAMSPQVVLAHRMNGEPLPGEHGFPLRAVVAGWYAVASIKWLRRIVVCDRPFAGYYQTADYSYWDRTNGLPSLRPITSLEVKSQIARPFAGECVQAGSHYRVHGAAWTGEGDVAAVEVSVNGGSTWSEARLMGDAVPWSWRLWEFDWQVPSSPGPVSLCVRATDSLGRTQPATRDPDRGTYLINHVVSVEVNVTR